MDAIETLEATSPLTVNRVVDTRGLLCPYPFIETKVALDGLPGGSTVEILTDSEATALSSIPVLCERNGYSFMSRKEGDNWRLLITKP